MWSSPSRPGSGQSTKCHYTCTTTAPRACALIFAHAYGIIDRKFGPGRGISIRPGSSGSLACPDARAGVSLGAPTAAGAAMRNGQTSPGLQLRLALCLGEYGSWPCDMDLGRAASRIHMRIRIRGRAVADWPGFAALPRPSGRGMAVGASSHPESNVRLVSLLCCQNGPGTAAYVHTKHSWGWPFRGSQYHNMVHSMHCIVRVGCLLKAHLSATTKYKS